MKIITVIGARPQFIKAAVVSRIIKQSKSIQEIIIHTGQHFDANMSHIFFEQMSIPKPDINLNINCLDQGAMVGRMIEKIEEVLKVEKPDWLLVYGDTNSTLAGALTAVKLHIPVAHVEAGLRSFNRAMPEEINRIVTDHISTVLFCPSDTSVENLRREGRTGENNGIRVLQVGDVMFDATLCYRPFSTRPGDLGGKLGDGFVLATVHRAENTDDPERLRGIVDALQTIASCVPVVVPLHPRTRACLQQLEQSSGLDLTSLTLISPVGYLEMIWLLDHCGLVMTDSGGLQKEAFFFGKPCVTLRDETEWIELVQNGSNMTVGSKCDDILEAYEKMKRRNCDFSARPYGDGQAGSRIVEELGRSN